MKIKDLQQKTPHSWPTEKEPWNRVHMDQAYISGIGLLLILMDSFSEWPDIVSIHDRKTDDKTNLTSNIFKEWGPKNISIR